MIMEINTPSGVYKIRKPTGRFGAKHMSLLMQIEPEKLDETVTVPTSEVAKVFEQWAVQVLPHLIVDGPYKYDEMPGEDQFVIFMKLALELQLTEEWFQVR